MTKFISKTYPNDIVYLDTTSGDVSTYKFMMRENTTQKIKMNVDFRRSFDMTKPTVDIITANAPYIDKYAIYRCAKSGNLVVFVGAKKLYIFQKDTSKNTMNFRNIVPTEVNTIDNIYYFDSTGTLIVSGGVYMDTQRPCYKSYKYTISTSSWAITATLLADADSEDSVVSKEDFGMMGDNVNNHISGQLYVLNYRQFGDRKDKNSVYYSGKSAVMKDGVLYNSTGLYNVQQSTNYQLRMPFR